MGANQPVVSLPRYRFEHGADFEVKYLGRRDSLGQVIKDVFVVIGAGSRLYLEMMKLLPRNRHEENNPRDWGFGDITDPTTGRRVWDFNSFARPLNFRGDMKTVCGEDNRTYVECRARDGALKHRFLLAELLPRWNLVAKLPVPPLLPQVPVTSEIELRPGIVIDVPTEAVVPTLKVTSAPALLPRVPEENPREAIAADVAKVVNRSSEMLYFVREVLSRMPRAPTQLRHF